tara:strand:- start:801 stop:1631 length:831 start_codon:yes stop_codon:yes gene_type:complete
MDTHNQEPHTIIFDTETTGLPPRGFYDVTRETVDKWDWARMLQIAWIICDKKGSIVKSSNYLIIDGKESITPESQKINKIDKKTLDQCGENFIEVISKFCADILKYNVDLFAGHNVEFDFNCVKQEMYRLPDQPKIYDRFLNSPTYCTMKKATNITKLKPVRYGQYKWPTLKELCNFYGIPFDDDKAHDGLYDTEKAMLCFNKMENKRPPPPPSVISQSEISESSQEENNSESNSETVSKIELETKTVKQLMQMCKDKNIKGYSNLRKADLVKLLQ